ncbi:ribosome maturation factor RimM [Phenylobacterium sp.]|uniref:ribosome maturation factor RimM n=1 Tax=Phenylobacterium sp. TaxID=1871053 RepID=UPI00273411E3|nr:ribosome maturation factor RimM [Phenylobacterium sp.]MDP3659274.1 ribosome maturation factor RimM [Phenylobacterium sp.]
MSERLILVARVGGAVGVRGEVRLSTFTEDPLSVAAYRDLRREDGSPGLTITSARIAKGGAVVRAKEVATRDQAEALRGLQLYVPRDLLPPPDEDEFYAADMVGLRVETQAGELLGLVKSVQDFGAGDLVEVQPTHGASWWLPFTREAVPVVSLAEGRLICVRPTEADEE